MCQDEVGQVRRVDRAVGAARVSFSGTEREISLLALGEDQSLAAGDWVVAYQGYVLEVLDERTATELLRDRFAAGVPGIADIREGDGT